MSRKKKPLVEKIESKITYRENKVRELKEKLADLKRVGFKYIKNENTL